MSLILDALNRADKQRKPVNDVPDLLDSVDDEGEEKPAPKLLVAVIALLSFTVVLLVVLLMNTSAEKDEKQIVSVDEDFKQVEQADLLVQKPAKSDLSVSPDPDSGSSQIIKKITPLKKPMSPSPPGSEEAISSLYQQSRAVPNNVARETTKQETDPGLAERARQAFEENAENQQYQQALLKQLVQATEKKTDARQSLGLASYSDVPYLHELAESRQSSIPSINYANHIYSDKGGAVQLNGKMYKPGTRIHADITLESIVSDGIVLNYKNEFRFKLSALNSWVNVQ